jgi:hypothetical protein
MRRIGRSRAAHLVLVPSQAPAPGRICQFCSYCGAAQERPEANQASRVCNDCGFGVILEAASELAPRPGDAFIVLDSSLSVCAVSRTAERLLETLETCAVNRHISELVVPADAEAQGSASLAIAVSHAARGDDAPRRMTVRPTNTFGIRLSARIGACGPANAALVVFD